MQLMDPTKKLLLNKHYSCMLVFQERLPISQVESLLSTPLGLTAYITAEKSFTLSNGVIVWGYAGYIESTIKDITPNLIKFSIEALIVFVNAVPVDSIKEILFDVGDLFYGTTGASIRYLSPDDLMIPNRVYYVVASWAPKTPPGLKTIRTRLEQKGLTVVYPEVATKTLKGSLGFLVATKDQTPSPQNLQDYIQAIDLVVGSEPVLEGATSSLVVAGSQISNVMRDTAEDVFDFGVFMSDILPDSGGWGFRDYMKALVFIVGGLGTGYLGWRMWTAGKRVGSKWAAGKRRESKP